MTITYLLGSWLSREAGLDIGGRRAVMSVSSPNWPVELGSQSYPAIKLIKRECHKMMKERTRKETWILRSESKTIYKDAGNDKLKIEV